MTLHELINSVDSEQYSDSALYQKLRETKPEYGSSRHIQVKLINGKVAITNAHVGSLRVTSRSNILPVWESPNKTQNNPPYRKGMGDFLYLCAIDGKV